MEMNPRDLKVGERFRLSKEVCRQILDEAPGDGPWSDGTLVVEYVGVLERHEEAVDLVLRTVNTGPPAVGYIVEATPNTCPYCGGYVADPATHPCVGAASPSSAGASRETDPEGLR